MKRVAHAAHDGGMAAAADVNPALMAKLPLEFKELGFGLHRRFDDLAKAAESGASREQVLTGLSTQLSTCVGCHASYRIEAVAAAKGLRTTLIIRWDYGRWQKLPMPEPRMPSSRTTVKRRRARRRDVRC